MDSQFGKEGAATWNKKFKTFTIAVPKAGTDAQVETSRTKREDYKVVDRVLS